MTSGTPIRITGGDPDGDEIAAVTVALLAVAGAAAGDDVPGPRPAPWDAPGAFQSPASWAGDAG